ncbi:MAG: Co2+/Mg2+ efflux protein ApaG [Robiginitomaculum sp.]|nr:MAG: Co2+/Mg2+ efflux protein ApaG [Robiginitomaculum sp.]
MYERRTRDVVVRVEPEFLAEQSSPADDRYIWAYTVEIENQSSEELQVVKRYWKIADRDGQVQEVSGEGVVGEIPMLKPGETFSYTSGAPLSAPSGVMLGHYGMKTEAGETYDVEIPAFSLDSPFEQRVIH